MDIKGSEILEQNNFAQNNYSVRLLRSLQRILNRRSVTSSTALSQGQMTSSHSSLNYKIRVEGWYHCLFHNNITHLSYVTVLAVIVQQCSQ